MGHPLLTSPDAERLLPPEMTYAEFLAWANEDTHAEWVDGKVLFMSPVSLAHQNVGAFVLNLILNYVQMLQLGQVLYESFQMKLGPNLPGREPDIAFVSQAHLDRLRPNFLDGPADLVVEVVSPESVHRDYEEKFAEYEQGGVQEYWLLDPRTQESWFYVLDSNGHYSLALPDAQGIYRSVALPGFWMQVGWLWQKPHPLLVDVLKAWGMV